MAAIGQVGIDLSEMAEDQPLDADFHRVANDARFGLSFREIYIRVQSGDPGS